MYACAAAAVQDAGGQGCMTEREFQAKLAELDKLLNDPEIRMDPDRVWALLAEISAQDMRATARA
jgi:hypothetical protein